MFVLYFFEFPEFCIPWASLLETLFSYAHLKSRRMKLHITILRDYDHLLNAINLYKEKKLQIIWIIIDNLLLVFA